MNSGTTQHRKDRQTEKDELPLIDLNRITLQVVDKVEEMYANNAVANLRNSGQFRQSSFPSLDPSQLYASYAPGTGNNNVLERPDIFGFRAEVCKNCLSLNCFDVLFPTAEGEGCALESSHRCDPNRISAAKDVHDKPRWMNELAKEVPRLLKEKIIQSDMFLNVLVAIKLPNPPPQIITIPNPRNPQRPLALGKALQVHSQLGLDNNDYNIWVWKAINLGLIGLTDEEVAEFLQIVNGPTFAVVEVHNRSRGQQFSSAFYFMYLANSLSIDFESIVRNQINSVTKASSATLAGIDGSKFQDSDMGGTGQHTGGHLEGSIHQCDPKSLMVCHSIPNKDETIANYRAKLPEAICNRIETQNQLLALQLSVCPTKLCTDIP
ncbi:MAG: hypothetical protein M3Y53_08530, partial [Thermoproteota archaeon]|nr:hypothetical protein [Thermoproteota archaeon]